MIRDRYALTTRVRGRFAPSPTGQLHFGSLVTAAGSWLQARSAGGEWIIRIEDLDRPREIPGAARQQLETLSRFGLRSDYPIVWQSRMSARYHAALSILLDAGLAYPCGCSRKDLPASGRYPGICRNGLGDRPPRSIRFRTAERDLVIDDRLQGQLIQSPWREGGDFVIKRADGLIAYQLAVVVDDALAGITEVVRGADLVDSAARQQLIYEALGWPTPSFMHLPLIVDEHGRKLSKSDSDDPIARYRPATVLRLALRALGHEPPRGCQSLESQWRWALSEWQFERIPRGPIAIGDHSGPAIQLKISAQPDSG